MKQINTKQLWKHNILWMSLLLFSWQFRAFNTLWWWPSGHNYVSFAHIIMYNYVGLESYKQKNSSYHELQPINEVSLHILHIPSLDAYYLPRFNEWMNQHRVLPAVWLYLPAINAQSFSISHGFSLSLTLLHWNSICSDSCVRKKINLALEIWSFKSLQ